jgi:cytochrome d ubiquinol oxidase subunit II
MAILWFCMVTFMVTVYVILDGFDLGAGAIHFFVTKNAAQRSQVIQSIGSVWDGNEVWLLAAGGTLYFAFPKLYAASFSGFYLPLMMVLWLLILRGIAIEFRNHINNVVWVPFWDVTFSAASALLAIFFGAALGNVVRGVPLDQDGRFFEPLWTSFRPVGETGILDWYTVIVGVTALSALTLHGALWVAMKTHDPISHRARRVGGVMWWATTVLTVTTTVMTLVVQPRVLINLRAYPWGAVFPGLGVLGIMAVWRYIAKSNDRMAFVASSTYLLGMMTSAAFGVYPYVLPASIGTRYGLTLFDAAAAPYGLRVGLVWWLTGMGLVGVYFVFVYRSFSGKVKAEAE